MQLTMVPLDREWLRKVVPQICSQNEDHGNRHWKYHETNLTGVGTPLCSGMMGRVGVRGLPILNQDSDSLTSR
jgi:hypothetical protein